MHTIATVMITTFVLSCSVLLTKYILIGIWKYNKSPISSLKTLLKEFF